MTTKTCPVCASDTVTSTTEKRVVTATLGPPWTYAAVVDSCATCGEVGDFEAVNDERIEVALRESEVASIRAMLDELASKGISNASLERALRLPQRTTARWKEGKLSAGAAALIRMVRTFPWMLEVADADYKPEQVVFTLMREAGRYVATAVAAQVHALSELPSTASSATNVHHVSFSGREFEPAASLSARIEDSSRSSLVVRHHPREAIVL